MFFFLPSFRFLLSVSKLVLQCIDVELRSGRDALGWELRLIDRFEVTGEIAATGAHLCRSRTNHVIIDLGHPGGELLSSDFETRQTLWHSSPFPAGKQRSDLLVFMGDWAQHRIGSWNKDQQIALQLIERHLLTGGRFVFRQFVEAHQLHRLLRFRNFYAQQFIETLLAFRERE